MAKPQKIAVSNPKPDKPTRPFTFRETILTGLADLKDSHQHQTAVMCGSGPTFATYQNATIPKSWVRFALNETIRTLGENANYWVLSDEPIVNRFSRYCLPSTRILAMHRASQLINKTCAQHWIRTVNSMDEIRDYKNGYEFFSRRTILIGAIEMARWLGFTRIFIFGADFYRLQNAYYYDGTEAISQSERFVTQQQEVQGVRHNGSRIYQTRALFDASQMLLKMKRSGLWDNLSIHVVNSPVSQQEAIPKMGLDEFSAIIKAEVEVDVKADVTSDIVVIGNNSELEKAGTLATS